MRTGESAPSTSVIVAAGGGSCLIAAIGLLMALLVPVFPLFGPTPYRGMVAIMCGLVPGLCAAVGVLIGLRRHDLGERRAALIAFSVPLLGLLLLVGGFVYLTTPA